MNPSKLPFSCFPRISISYLFRAGLKFPFSCWAYRGYIPSATESSLTPNLSRVLVWDCQVYLLLLVVDSFFRMTIYSNRWTQYHKVALFTTIRVIPWVNSVSVRSRSYMADVAVSRPMVKGCITSCIWGNYTWSPFYSYSKLLAGLGSTGAKIAIASSRAGTSSMKISLKCLSTVRRWLPRWISKTASRSTQLDWLLVNNVNNDVEGYFNKEKNICGLIQLHI